MLRRATPVKVPAEGWQRLQDGGLQPETTPQASDLLAALWQNETDYVRKHSMMETLKQELMSSLERGKRKQERRSRLLKFMRQIQVRKQMSSVKDANGSKSQN